VGEGLKIFDELSVLDSSVILALNNAHAKETSELDEMSLGDSLRNKWVEICG
jgi:predicted GNAT superfamily acetyltransferase